MTLLIVIIILALVFDYINGFHDAANSIATVVSTKVLTPFQAVLWAALFNVIAFFIFKDHSVANTIAKTVKPSFITLPVIFSGLIAAIFWNLLTWWYGIPSSSSHTLIGGFAGAAICAAFLKDSNTELWQIIDNGKIGKTVLFIFCAPLIGMLISMFFTIVMVNPNTWLKCGILALTGAGIWFSFIQFQNGKVQENVTKFYRIEKNETIVKEEQLKLAKEKDIAKIEAINKLIAETQEKVTKANTAVGISKPFLEQYESNGADFVVKGILENADIKTTITSRFGDKLKSFFEVDKKTALYNKDTANKDLKAAMKFAKVSVDSLKQYGKMYHTVGWDSMVATMVAKQGFTDPKEISTFKNKMTSLDEKELAAARASGSKDLVGIAKDLKKEIVKSDNKILRYFLLGAFLIFILSFIYTEKIKTPSASRTSSLFKRLQLLSSAGFSIGHGGNDAQKVMGIIAAVLVANGDYNAIDQAMKQDWIPLACYAAIGLGTLSGGWKIVKTMGTKITKVTPLEGVTAETAGATTLFLTEQMGIPVSTTHTITGAIIGVGATKRLSAVRWGVTVNLLWAWILTIPISATVAALTYYIVQLIGLK